MYVARGRAARWVFQRPKLQRALCRSIRLLAEFMLHWKEKTAYSEPGDWVFASFRLKGRQPRVANMLVEDYLRPAAAKAGILSSHRDDCERLVEDDPRRFGFHNLRHSLA